MAFNVEEPRDTHGRWIRLGRGDLERLMHAAVDARAHDIARENGHDEAKAQQIQAHLRRQALAKLPAAPVYNVRIRDHNGVKAYDIHVPGSDKHRNIVIPNAKRRGNLEQVDRRGKPAEGEVDHPNQHGLVTGTETIAGRMKEAVGGGPPNPDPEVRRRDMKDFERQREFDKGIRQAAKAVAAQNRANLPAPEPTAQPERQAREMEAAGARGDVPAVAAKKAAELIRDEGGVKEARRVAKGAAKKALDKQFGTPDPGQQPPAEQELQNGAVERLKELRVGGVGKFKYSGYINGRKVFIKMDKGAYGQPGNRGFGGALRAGVPAGRPDGPSERGAYLVGNIMGVQGKPGGGMPIVVVRDVADMGRGMAKEMVPGDPGGGSPTSEYKRRKLWSIMDLAIGNLDRHVGNHLRSEQDRNEYYPMDHGLGFPDDNDHGGLGRGLSRLFGSPLTQEERDALQRVVDHKVELNKQLRASGLDERQISSMWGRVHGALAAGRYPNSEREAAQWGVPGRVEGDAGAAARVEGQNVNPDQYGAEARRLFRQRIGNANDMEHEAAMQHLQELHKIAVEKEAAAAAAVGRDPQAGYHARRWAVVQEQVKAKQVELQDAQNARIRDIGAGMAGVDLARAHLNIARQYANDGRLEAADRRLVQARDALPPQHRVRSIISRAHAVFNKPNKAKHIDDAIAALQERNMPVQPAGRMQPIPSGVHYADRAKILDLAKEAADRLDIAHLNQLQVRAAGQVTRARNANNQLRAAAWERVVATIEQHLASARRRRAG